MQFWNLYYLQARNAMIYKLLLFTTALMCSLLLSVSCDKAGAMKMAQRAKDSVHVQQLQGRWRLSSSALRYKSTEEFHNTSWDNQYPNFKYWIAFSNLDPITEDGDSLGLWSNGELSFFDYYNSCNGQYRLKADSIKLAFGSCSKDMPPYGFGPPFSGMITSELFHDSRTDKHSKNRIHTYRITEDTLIFSLQNGGWIKFKRIK